MKIMTLPPLLFIPFIENAFKHGVSYQGKSFIEISLRSGSRSDHIHSEKQHTPGRMAAPPGSLRASALKMSGRGSRCFTPDRHELWIEEQDSVFSVRLAIKT
ncbi:MAG: hypothetical protein MZV63_50150 [Marinilabiliales bacterium]|nr:hypothetical protein [Marinilabiliales bacterium]